MKKFFFLSVILALFSMFAYAQKGYEVKFSQPQSNEYQLSFQLTDWNLTKVEFGGVTYQQIVFNSSTVTQEKGWAELPFISASVQLPAQKNVDLSVTYTRYTDYDLNFPLVPSRGSFNRNQDPGTIPYVIDPASIVNQFYPVELAKAEEPYIIRDVRGTSVRVFPFQYNAATNTLRVYTQVNVVLTENQEPATNPLLTENANPIREVRGMYRSIFINYQEPRTPSYMAEYGDILVITTSRDEAAIQPYIDWKKEKGYNVTKEVVTTGTNVKSLIQSKYTANQNLMYVLLVGGWNEIKSDMFTSALGNGSGPTDPMLGDVSGNASDYRPDISIGRMSASSAAQVTIQVNKTIQYEKNPTLDPSWRETFIGIASEYGGGSQGDDGESDITHMTRVYTERLQTPIFTYNTFKQNFGASATASTLAGHINAGSSNIGYVGHGSETSWGTTGFSTSNVSNLTNGTKLPFITSVACLNGAFHSQNGNCFAEAWLKKDNGGAVIAWMSTISQPWNEPMRGQDYFYDILIGGFKYSNYPGQNGISTDEQRTLWGSLVVNSVNLMLSESSGTGDKETVRSWTTFGDPSLQLRTKLPDQLTSSMNTILVGMPYTTTITANGNPVKNALVCISQNGVYYHAFTDADGNVSITNDFLPGNVLLVVTAFNTTTIYQNIDCVPAEGAYLIYDNYAVVGAEKLTYTSTNQEIAVTVKNVGSAATTGPVNVTISCTDSLLTIDNGAAQYTGTIAPNGTATVNFNVSVSHDIQDGKTFPVDVTVTSTGKTVWNSKMTLKAYAPNFSLSKVLVNGVENAKLPKGNMSKITCVVENKGGADAFAITGELVVNNEFVIIPCDDNKNRETKNLPAGESINLDFFVITSPYIQSGYNVNMNLLLSAMYERSFTAPFTVTSSTPVLENTCSSGNQDCSGGDKFTSVQILKGTTVLLSNTSGDCASGGYQNYTNMVVPLEPGQQYTIKIKCGYASQQVGGWFDLNGNNTFETTEKLITMTGGTSETTSTFTIPATATAGEYRFRLVSKWNAAPAACSNSSYGQTHDYTFSIPNTLPQVQNVNAVLNKVDETITVTWQAPTGEMPIGYNIYRNGKLNATPLTDSTYMENNVVEGIYVYNVTAVYEGNKESSAKMSNVVCYILPKLCEVPANLSYTMTDNSITITWDEPENIDGVLTSYEIYRDNEKVGETTAEVREYQDTELENGTYVYQVVAVYGHCESDKSEELIIEYVKINELQTSSFKLFPNPTKNEINITGTVAPTYVGIYNITGQLMYETTNCSTNMKISVSSLSSGIYFVRIVSENGITTKKVVVEN